MKKFASLFISVLLVMSMVFCGVVSASAAAHDIDVNNVGKSSITITKRDADDHNKTLAGSVFTAYQVLDYDPAKGAYSINANFADVVTDIDAIVKSVDTNGDANGWATYGSTADLEALITSLTLKSKTLTDPTAYKNSNESKADGIAKIENLNFGVYLVRETVFPRGATSQSEAFLVTLPQWNKDNNAWMYDVPVEPKNKILTITKEMTKDNSKADSYSIGDTITFQINSQIPNYGNSIIQKDWQLTDKLLADTNITATDAVARYNALNLVFTDTMSDGLTLDLASLEVEVKTKDGWKTLAKGDTLAELKTIARTEGQQAVKTPLEGQYSSTGAYTATEKTDTTNGNATVMTVTVAWNVLNNNQGENIRLTYDAVLNEKAEITTGELNEIDYQFKNDPYQDDDDLELIEDSDKVYTYQMDLTKTLQGKKKAEVASVKFQLFDTEYKADQSKPMNFIKNDDGTYTLWVGKVENGKAVIKDANNKVLKDLGAVVTEISPIGSGNDMGLVRVYGLEEGTYYLKETLSASGYSILPAPLKVVVSEVKDQSGVVTGNVSAKVENDDVVTAKDGVFLFTIDNPENEFELPVTGGMGLILFTVGAGVILAAAFIIIARLRKKEA